MTSPRAHTGARHAVTLLLLALALPCSLAAEPRLGDDVVPTFAAVRLRLDPGQADYRGTVAVDLDVRRPTSEVRFHARGQVFQRVALTRDGRPVEVTVERAERDTTGDTGYTVARAAAPLSPGAYRLEIDFTKPFDTRAVGLYRMEKDGRHYAFTQFEAIDARGAFPCWDEPGFKQPWQVTLEVPTALEAVTNTPVERETAAGDWKTLAFARTPPMPSYLIALAVGPFEYTPIPGLSIPGRVVSPAGQGKLAGLAAEITPPLLAAAERYFGQPYPYAKLDLIAVPEFWPGAMENPGAVTYADGILLVDPRAATGRQRATLAYVTAHELAHMWFGNLVTMGWWDDLWLNESFADWMAVKIVEEVSPRLRVGQRELQEVQEAMETDARPSARPVRQPIEEPDQAVQQVGLVYDKGKAVLGMFEAWLGPEVFRRGVVDYLRSRAWGNAVAGDFWAALERASGRRDFAAAMAGFIDQPGVPLVEAAPLPGGRLRLTQRRFLPRGGDAPPVAWTIPVGLKVSDGSSVHTVRILLGPAGQEVQVPGLAPGARIAWVMPNLEAAGYYRWQVPEEMLLVLAEQADSALDPRERIALLGNLSALLDAGLLGGDRYLAVLAALADDPEPWVVSSALAGLERVEPIVPERQRGAFAAYVRRALAPTLARFGAEPRAGEDEIVTLVRPELLSLLGEAGEDEAVLAAAREMTRRLLADPASVDPSLAGTALELAARSGDRALFEQLRTRFERAQVPAERDRYLRALGSFRDPALVEEALRYSLEGPLHANERFRIPLSIGSSGERGNARIFDWTLANFDKIAALVPPTAIARMPLAAGNCSAERLARAREFFAKPPRNVPGTDRQLAQLADNVALCTALTESEGPAIAAYLEKAAAEGSGQSPAAPATGQSAHD